MVAVPTAFFASQLKSGELGYGDRYVVPLTGRYVVQSADQGDSEFSTYGPFQLEKITAEGLSRWDSFVPEYSYPTSDPVSLPSQGASLFLPNVVKVAVQGHVIAGCTNSKFFLINTDSDQPDVVFYDNEPEYEAALARAGIQGIQLLDPAEMAAKLPGETLRPWAYRFWNGRWGHSDSWWSGFIVDCGFEASLFAGLLLPRGRLPRTKVRSRLALLAIAVALGWYDYRISGIVSDDVPALDFFAFLMLPLMFITAAVWGRGARYLLSNPAAPVL